VSAVVATGVEPEAADRPPVSARQAARLHEAFATAAAVASATELGVFAILEQSPADPVTIAGACGLTERGARALLAALAGLRLVERQENGCYRAASSGLASFRTLLGSWRTISPALQGELRQGGDTVAGAESLYPGLVAQLGAMFAESAERAAQFLTEPGQRVLDVGAGAAPWSIALARRDPRCRVTAVDLPGVLEQTRLAVRAAELESRYRLVPGDAFHLEAAAGEGYDLALAANLFHLFDEEANRKLIRRLAASLRPGGRIAIIDVVPNERLDGPRGAVLYGLGLLQRTATGTIYPYSAYRRWLEEVGFEEARRRAIGGPLPLTLMTARLR
jgi:ubiquinone/menaquinone biosynthesis C-methylase UbiE